MKNDIHKPGRPVKYNDNFYISIVNEFENFTIREIAKNHNVSRESVNRWLRKGRDLVNAEQK